MRWPRPNSPASKKSTLLVHPMSRAISPPFRTPQLSIFQYWIECELDGYTGQHSGTFVTTNSVVLLR